MINFYDYNSVEAIAEARRNQFLSDARQYRIAQEVHGRNGRSSSRVRRAIGVGLIRAGARLAGDNHRVLATS